MSPTLPQPTTSAELAEAIRSMPRVIVVGAGTKPRLAGVADDFVRIATTKLRGIVEYEPSEFTFTALAGTPLTEIVAALAERGQYLPFDPLFAEVGATIGGTVAAGVSGPGRFRFGGLRDFILGVRFVDGEGRLMRMGGKVVKNAAGFDLAKFFVGSLGRFGALAEVTFKVFPRAQATRTLRLLAQDATALTKMLTEAANTRWELDALEAAPGEGVVYARLAGPSEALDVLAAEIFVRWPGRALAADEAQRLWRDVGECAWAHRGGTLIKLAITPSAVPQLMERCGQLPEAKSWISAGGNVAWVSLPAGKSLAAKWPWPAVTVRGAGPLWPGTQPEFEIFRAVKTALDPQGRFPALDDGQSGSETRPTF